MLEGSDSSDVRSVEMSSCARRHTVSLATTLSLAAVSLAGCGLGAGSAPSAVHLLVTRDFGAAVVRSWSAPRVRGGGNVVRPLVRHGTVGQRYGGRLRGRHRGPGGGGTPGPAGDWVL